MDDEIDVGSFGTELLLKAVSNCSDEFKSELSYELKKLL